MARWPSTQVAAWSCTENGRRQGRRNDQTRTRRPLTAVHVPVVSSQVRQPSAATARAHRFFVAVSFGVPLRCAVLPAVHGGTVAVGGDVQGYAVSESATSLAVTGWPISS